MSETVYIHRAPVEGSDGPVGVVFTTRRAAVVYTGLEVHTEKDAPLLEEIEALCGLSFFRREQDLPLYGVPCLYVFAADGAGGVLACAGDEEGPVYHIPPPSCPIWPPPPLPRCWRRPLRIRTGGKNVWQAVPGPACRRLRRGGRRFAKPWVSPVRSGPRPLPCPRGSSPPGRRRRGYIPSRRWRSFWSERPVFRSGP